MIVGLEILPRLELNQCIVHARPFHQILRAAVTETVFKILLIDAGARTDVYNIIKGLSKKGLAVLLISSDMEEIIELSDRAVTIHQGRLNCEFKRSEINQENLTSASFGVAGKEKE